MWLLPFFKTLFKSLSKKAPTHTYPYAPMPKDPIVRGHVEIDIVNCIFCNICTRKCPTDAIVVDRKGKEWEIAHFQCIVCGACVEACPKKCLYMRPELIPASDVRTKKKVIADIQVEETLIADTQVKELVTADA